MIIPDKYENLNESIIVISMNIFNNIKKKKVLSYHDLSSCLKNKEWKPVNHTNFICALLLLYAFNKIEYIVEKDIFKLKNSLDEIK